MIWITNILNKRRGFEVGVYTAYIIQGANMYESKNKENPSYFDDELVDIQVEIDKIAAPKFSLAPAMSLLGLSSLLVAFFTGGLTAVRNFGLPLAAAESSDHSILSKETAIWGTSGGSKTQISDICKWSQTVRECATNICILVTKNLKPLNKYRVGQSKHHPDDVKEHMRMLQTVDEEFPEKARQLISRGEKVGLQATSPAMIYLRNLEYFIINSKLRNCAGGTASTLFIALQQKLLENALLGYHVAYLKSNGPSSNHVTARFAEKIHSKAKPEILICDPFSIENSDNSPGTGELCSGEEVKSGKPVKCKNFRSAFWTNNPEDTFGIEHLSANKLHLSSKQKKFFEQETNRQLQEFRNIHSEFEDSGAIYLP
jgi:hypothetical protein